MGKEHTARLATEQAEQLEEEQQLSDFQGLLQAHFMEEVHKGEAAWEEAHARKLAALREDCRRMRAAHMQQ